jgi:hypothetical protein
MRNDNRFYLDNGDSRFFSCGCLLNCHNSLRDSLHLQMQEEAQVKKVEERRTAKATVTTLNHLLVI